MIYEIMGVLVASFLLNIIPFAGPSNLFIASNWAIIADVDPLIIGFLVALGSVSAKFIHYIVTFFVSKHIGEERRKKLDAASLRLKKWAFVALFVVAASPLPDEPVIIPLGILRYSPSKLFVAYFSGKLIIAIAGAYMGKLAQDVFASWMSTDVLMIISIVLTVVITIVLLKVDWERLLERVLKRKIEFA